MSILAIPADELDPDANRDYRRLLIVRFPAIVEISMKTLALETSGFAGSVAALDDATVVVEYSLDASSRSAQSLAPAMRGLLQQVGWRPAQLDLIAVASGPGSFTGLRVGVVTAKTLAYATGAALADVNTLEAVAARVTAEDGFASRTGRGGSEVHAVLDAGRQQFYAATFQVLLDGPVREIVPTRLVEYDWWLADLPLDAQVSGPGLDKVMGRIPSHVHVVDRSLWSPQAADVGKLGRARYLNGQKADPWKLVPNYFRLSAAEEKLAESRDAANGAA